MIRNVLVKKLYPDVDRRHPSKKVTLMLDWHESRINLPWIVYCSNKGIIIKMLIPQATGKMQKEASFRERERGNSSYVGQDVAG